MVFAFFVGRLQYGTFGTTGATGTSTAERAVVTPHRSIPGAYSGRDFRLACPGWPRYTPDSGGAHTIFFIAPSSTFRRRGLVDAARAAVLVQGGLRRSEAAALTWRDVTEATTDDSLLLTIRQSKTKSTNPRRRGAGGTTPEFRSRPRLTAHSGRVGLAAAGSQPREDAHRASAKTRYCEAPCASTGHPLRLRHI